jgi:hypothetical protein
MPFGASALELDSTFFSELELSTFAELDSGDFSELELDGTTEELEATSLELGTTSEELLGTSAELAGAAWELDAGAISELETGASPQAFGKLDAKHLSSELELSAVDSMLDEEISPVDDNGEVAESSPQLIKAMALAKITPLKIFDFILGTPFLPRP